MKKILKEINEALDSCWEDRGELVYITLSPKQARKLIKKLTKNERKI